MPTYSCDMGKEAAIMAVISLVLTFINIVCILITATIVLKVTVTNKMTFKKQVNVFYIYWFAISNSMISFVFYVLTD